MVDALVAADRRGQRPTLRTLGRMISSAEAVTETPVLSGSKLNVARPKNLRNLRLHYSGLVFPFYIRDFVSLGPFRINLSKSGLGISAGLKRFNIETGPKGHYVHAGMNGIYDRKTLRGLGRKPKASPANDTTDYRSEIARIAPDDKLQTYMTEDGVLMRRIISAEADALVSESHAEALRSLNEARERPSYTLIRCGAAGACFVPGVSEPRR